MVEIIGQGCALGGGMDRRGRARLHKRLGREGVDRRVAETIRKPAQAMMTPKPIAVMPPSSSRPKAC